MKPPRLPPILWVFPLAVTTLACPTRTVPFDAGAHADAINDLAGSGGSLGGAAGVDTTTTGTGGAAGFGAAGVGGIAGVGAAAGIGGAAGAGGTVGTGGSAGVGGVAGTSSVKDGQPCSLANDCASGTCTPFYVDIDGDGYGAGQAIGFCGTTPPIGYSAQSGDCCDSASNLAIAKLIHPGADFQPTSAGGVCNITWDYDCSGRIEKDRMNCASCTQAPCGCAYTDFPDSDCGVGMAGMGCSLSGYPQQVCQLFAGGVGPVACK
jgi:hypothetical protein